MEREDLGWLVRAVLASLVFLLALTAFRLGVGVSAREHLPELGVLAQVYYSAGLFVLGGMALGTPIGGPHFARSLLWGARSLDDAWGGALPSRIHVFNSRRAAAKHLYQQHLREHFADTPAKDTVVLAGFGRFAQTILEFLGRESEDEIERVLVAAPSAARGLRKFHSHVHPSEFLIKPLDGDLMDPATWQAIGVEIAESSTPPTVLIACEDESVNLQSALLARRRWPESRVFVRCRDVSSFAEELAALHHFTLLPVETLVREALYRSQARWFREPRKGSASGRQVGLVPEKVS